MLDGEAWAISVALTGETKEQECSALIGLIFIKPFIPEMFCVTWEGFDFQFVCLTDESYASLDFERTNCRLLCS